MAVAVSMQLAEFSLGYDGIYKVGGRCDLITEGGVTKDNVRGGWCARTLHPSSCITTRTLQHTPTSEIEKKIVVTLYKTRKKIYNNKTYSHNTKT